MIVDSLLLIRDLDRLNFKSNEEAFTVLWRLVSESKYAFFLRWDSFDWVFVNIHEIGRWASFKPYFLSVASTFD